jgi:hypothetical protein
VRLTCPACRAPFFPPDDGPSPPRCPNCGAEYAAPAHPWWDPAGEAEPVPEPRSRALTIAGWLHFLPAAGSLCLAAGAAEVVGIDPRFGGELAVVAAALAVGWLVSGLGVLFRAGFARWTAPVLSALWAVGALTSADRNVVGAAVVLLAVGYIWTAVIVCWNEFR